MAYFYKIDIQTYVYKGEAITQAEYPTNLKFTDYDKTVMKQYEFKQHNSTATTMANDSYRPRVNQSVFVQKIEILDSKSKLGDKSSSKDVSKNIKCHRETNPSAIVRTLR